MNDTDFALAWEGASGPSDPWQHLRVVEFRGTEGISTLYRYEITAHLRGPVPAVDPDELVGARATLRIATHTEPPVRFVHGIVTEAEELGATDHGTLYRLVLSPPLVRAAHRVRCRVFLDRTLRQILEALLREDSAFTAEDGAGAEHGEGVVRFAPAREVYALRVSRSARIDQVTARPYCVQYNESDLAFLSRLLEEEGISYHFEHDEGVCRLVLADQDAGRARFEPSLPLGPDIKGREVRSMKLGARLRARRVSLQEYDWRKPALPMAVEQSGGAGDLIDHEYPGRYTEAPDLGSPLAAARLDRLGFEASYALGEGACRLLSAGQIFALEGMSDRHDGEYLVTRMVVRGMQHGELPPSAALQAAGEGVPYAATFECARRGKGAESRFRPARVTPRPRIMGVQTAVVTAEPSASGKEIHIGGPPGGEIGCVRVKFHWDQDSARHGREPTSCWVRVSQVFAGAGQGAVWHPRVGVEVLVEHEEGDPDRPIVVGRVYNGQNRPPTVVPEVSTMKSMTTPGDGTFNELTFDDTAGKQQIKLHASRDWNSEVAHDRTETVANDSTSSVGVNRTESTGNDRASSVGNDSASSVGANRTESTGEDRSTMVGANNAEVVGGNETITVGGNQTIGVGMDQAVSVTGHQRVSVTRSQQVDVAEDQRVGIKGRQAVDVEGDRSLTVRGEELVTVEKTQITHYKADHHLTVGTTQRIAAALEQDLGAGALQKITSGAVQEIAAPLQRLSSSQLTLAAAGSALLASRRIDISAQGGPGEGAAGGVAAAAGAGPREPPIVDIHSGGVVRIGGKRLEVSFTEEIVLDCKLIRLVASEIEINGSCTTRMTGDRLVEISGALIKLN